MSDKPDTSKDPLKDIAYTPFQEPVIERDYTQGNIDASGATEELEEPKFTAPSLEDFEEMDKIEEESGSKSKPEPETPFNPHFNQLGNKEKQMGAETLADVTIDAYKKLCKAMGNVAKVSETKLEKEFAEEKIDPNLQIPVDQYGNTANPKEYFEELNKESQTTFEVSDEFVDNVRPPLIRVFKKKGIGLTDEQLLLYYGITDISQKGIALFQLKKSTNQILENMRIQTEYMRTQGHTFQRPEPPEQHDTSKSQAEADKKAKEDFMSKDFVEPEETEFQDEIFVNETGIMTIQPQKGFAETKAHDNMPKFGEKAILDDMERIAKAETSKPPSPKKPQTNRTTKKKPRKTTTKK
jgi:hypothetical protein